MVGDAANDVAAIAYADIGIGVQSTIGENVVEKHADITLQEGNLFSIATAFDVAQKTHSNIFQNLCISLGYNSLITLVAAGALVALGFTLNPIAGVALMVVESSLVLGNLYRLKTQSVLSKEEPMQNAEMLSSPAAENAQRQDSTSALLQRMTSIISLADVTDEVKDAKQACMNSTGMPGVSNTVPFFKAAKEDEVAELHTLRSSARIACA